MSVRRIVVDTNVLVSAVLSRDGAAREIVRRCLTREAVPLIGNALFSEYEDVFAREPLFRNAPIGPGARSELLDAFLSTCLWISIAYLWRPNLRDEADNQLIELAVAGNAEAIITGNTKDLASGELVFERIRLRTPAAFLKEED